MVVATKRGFDWAGTVQRGARIRVATKYVKTAREHFAAKGMHVDLIKLYGSMELAPLAGLADAIVDLVSSGNTLKANDLVVVEDILPISARLIVNPAALKLKRDVVQPLLDALAAGASTARRSAGARSIAVSSARAARVRRLDARGAGLRARARGAHRVRGGAGSGASTRRSRGSSPTCAAAATRRLLEYTARFDGVRRDVGGGARNRRRRDARARSTRCRRPMRAALRTAAARIRAFHERQALASWSYRDADGSEFGQRVTPLDRVGVYVPGGKAAYPSSVLMNVIPAHVAGVAEIVMVVPDARRRAQSAGARGRASRRRDARVRDRRRAGDRRARLRHGDGPGRRQDLRPRQRLCRRGEAPRVRRGRHRHGRRRVRGSRHRRRAAPTPTGSRWTSSRRPSTTSSRRRSSSRPTPR